MPCRHLCGHHRELILHCLPGRQHQHKRIEFVQSAGADALQLEPGPVLPVSYRHSFELPAGNLQQHRECRRVHALRHRILPACRWRDFVHRMRRRPDHHGHGIDLVPGGIERRDVQRHSGLLLPRLVLRTSAVPGGYL